MCMICGMDDMLGRCKIYTGSVERPYIQSLVGHATDTLFLKACRRGYKRVREGGAPKSLMRGLT
jgi:hypothetical protein